MQQVSDNSHRSRSLQRHRCTGEKSDRLAVPIPRHLSEISQRTGKVHSLLEVKNSAFVNKRSVMIRPLCSRLRPDVRDRQTSDTHHRLMYPPHGGRGIIRTSRVLGRLPLPSAKQPNPQLGNPSQSLLMMQAI